MGLLGGGDDSLAASSGWGMLPPINSSADWGNSSSSGIGGANNSTNHWQSSSSSSSGGNGNGNNGRQNNTLSSNHSNSATSDHQLSSSPKPSSSWAQAAGKGLVNASASSSSSSSASSAATSSSNNNIGPSNNSINSHESSTSSYSSATATLGAQLGPLSANDRNLNGGVSLIATTTMSGSSMNASCSNNNSAFQSSSGSGNCATGGLIGGSGKNAIDAAVVNNNNKQRQIAAGPSSGSTAGISDLIDQLSDDFRETLLTEKWGSSVINHDSPWNLPPSPQSSPKDTSTWRCPVNSGTEIWENAVRQKKGSVGGGSSAAPSIGLGAPTSAQPWGQPQTHIGGTWGEEEDPASHWTGVPQSSSLNAVTGSSGGSGVAVGAVANVGSGNNNHNNSNNGAFGGNAVSTGPPTLGGGNCVNSASITNNWSAGSGLANGSGISSYSLLNSAGGNGGGGSGIGGTGFGANSIGGSLGDTANPTANSWNGNADKSSFESRSKGPNWNNFDQIDSAPEQIWEKSINSNSESSEFGTWDKESHERGGGSGGAPDDGTAVWGNPRRQNRMAAGWKEDKYGNNKNGPNGGWNVNGNGGGGNGGNGGGNKSNQPMQRTWTDSSVQRKSPSLWNDDAKSLNGSGSFLRGSSVAMPIHGNSNNCNSNTRTAPFLPLPVFDCDDTGNMSDGQIDTSNWFANKASKPLSRELIQSSKQFRMLVDIGYKKEDVENALRIHSMRFDDALLDLQTKNKSSSALPTLNRMPSNRGQASNMPNSAHLAQLVQRIQLAINSGFLSPQILNHPLSSQNLEILNEFLSQVKMLKELQTNVHIQQLNGSAKQSFDIKIHQIKQNIATLQNQLPPFYRNDAPPPINKLPLNDFMKSNNDLYGGTTGMTNDGNVGASDISGGGASGPQGSRLHSWKQTSYNKPQQQQQQHLNEDKLNADFIRAPGPLSKQSSASSNWSNFPMDDSASGWPSDLTSQFGKQDKSDLGAGQFSLIDDPSLSSFPVQDSFDSYKSTWKPTAKGLGVDDDPRSPISQNAMLKDSMFSWNSTSVANPKSNSLLGGNSSNQSQMDSLNSFGFGGGANNPWSYSSGPAGGNGNSQTANSAMFSDMNKKSSVAKSTWGNQGLNSDYSDSLWSSAGGGGSNSGGNGATGKPRPPPGLSQPKNSNSSNSNSIWSQSALSASSSSGNSEYVRLRNLTPQIDGSTLKTLCLQHGPLHLFHLFLNHGTAIIRYSNREQAFKAQAALNNCVLGNSSILADLPPESEVQQYLQLINGGGHSANINSSNGVSGGSGNSRPGASGHQQSSQQQQQQAPGHHHHHHHGAHHSQSYNSSWSNGTNTSQSAAGGVGATGVGGSTVAAQSAPQSNALYSRTSSIGLGSNTSAAAAAHMFGNSFSSIQQTSPASSSTLPYGVGAAPVLVTTHSSSLPYNVLNQASAASSAAAVSASQCFNKMDNALLSGWNTGATGSNNLWDSSSLGGGMWSSAATFSADRNTPIQNFLPGDLLASENN